MRQANTSRPFATDFPVAQTAFELKVGYVESSELQGQLAALSHHPLAVISFGGSDTSRLPSSCINIELPQIAGPAMCEIWSSAQPVQTQHDDMMSLAMNGECVIGTMSLDEEAGTPLDVTVQTAYRNLLCRMRELGYLHIWRVWNYLPRINDDDGEGLERYKKFCVGRYQALTECMEDFPFSIPAGTAVGTITGPLRILFLAGRRRATHLSNPRQMNAYDYPQDYGPRSPSFARASLCRLDRESHLFIAGTASVVGHASRHIGLPGKQTRETIHNLITLVNHARRAVGADLVSRQGRAIYKVYVRNPDHLTVIRKVLHHSELPLDGVVFLQADLCRRELLVEIEGVITTPIR